MSIIKAEKLSYTHRSGRGCPALHELSFEIREGEFAVFLGGSGSGKSSLALLINALLPVEKGILTVCGMDCGDEAQCWDIRRSCGLLFQNPDDQFISTYAREDLGFAARNFLDEGENIDERVQEALKTVYMSGYADSTPQLLPLAMRQRLALASLLVYDPKILILDAPFSALDAASADILWEIVNSLRQQGKTVLLMTNDAEQATAADRVYLLKEGRLLAQGSPRELLADRKLMDEAGIKPPFTVKVYNDLLDAGAQLERCPLTIEELVEEVCL